jgi:hypothetical protein
MEVHGESNNCLCFPVYLRALCASVVNEGLQ